MSTNKPTFLSFEDWKKAVKNSKLKITSGADYKRLGKNRPAGWPSEPWNTFKKDGWKDWSFLTAKEEAKVIPIKKEKQPTEAEQLTQQVKTEGPIVDVEFTLEQAIAACPAIATKERHPKLSERYKHTNTSKILKNIMDSDTGWKITSVRQTSIRDEKMRKYTHHVVKLENDSMVKLKGGDRIQIVISNSHNGVSKFEFYFGIWVKICSNGLIVNTPMFNGINKKHFTDYEEINTYITECVKRMKELVEMVDDFKAKQLTHKEKLDLAIKALHARYQYKNSYLELMYEGLKERYDLASLIKPTRPENENDSLWSVFNTVQEKITKGEYYAKVDSGLSKANPIKNTHCELQFNKMLWLYAAEFVAKK